MKSAFEAVSVMMIEAALGGGFVKDICRSIDSRKAHFTLLYGLYAVKAVRRAVFFTAGAQQKTV